MPLWIFTFLRFWPPDIHSISFSWHLWWSLCFLSDILYIFSHKFSCLLDYVNGLLVIKLGYGYIFSPHFSFFEGVLVFFRVYYSFFLVLCGILFVLPWKVINRFLLSVELKFSSWHVNALSIYNRWRCLSDKKSPYVTRTLLSILVILCNAVVRMLSTCPLISNRSFITV